MRTVLITISTIAALSCVKVHLIRDEYARPASQVVLTAPWKPVFDSPTAECLRHWDEGIPTCLRAFEAKRGSALKIFNASLCQWCADRAEFWAGSGLPPDVFNARRRDVKDATGAI
jgi:hypothetical protein